MAQPVISTCWGAASLGLVRLAERMLLGMQQLSEVQNLSSPCSSAHYLCFSVWRHYLRCGITKAFCLAFWSQYVCEISWLQSYLIFVCFQFRQQFTHRCQFTCTFIEYFQVLLTINSWEYCKKKSSCPERQAKSIVCLPRREALPTGFPFSEISCLFCRSSSLHVAAKEHWEGLRWFFSPQRGWICSMGGRREWSGN